MRGEEYKMKQKYTVMSTKNGDAISHKYLGKIAVGKNYQCPCMVEVDKTYGKEISYLQKIAENHENLFKENSKLVSLSTTFVETINNDGWLKTFMNKFYGVACDCLRSD